LDFVGRVEESVDVARYLSDIVDRGARRLSVLVLQQFKERGLRALDLAREYCFLPYIHV
jgi:hypothetical protein